MTTADRSHSHTHVHGRLHDETMPPAKDHVIDPVCGMTVDVNAGKPSFEHKGHTYYFCSEGCRTKFAKEPVIVQLVSRPL